MPKSSFVHFNIVVKHLKHVNKFCSLKETVIFFYCTTVSVYLTICFWPMKCVLVVVVVGGGGGGDVVVVAAIVVDVLLLLL